MRRKSEIDGYFRRALDMHSIKEPPYIVPKMIILMQAPRLDPSRGQPMHLTSRDEDFFPFTPRAVTYVMLTLSHTFFVTDLPGAGLLLKRPEWAIM